MSKKYRDLIRARSTVKRTPRAVLNVLADYATDDGIAWPSVTTIANDSGFSERTVIRALQELLQLGHIVIVQNGRGGRKRTTRYQILFPETPSTCQGLEAEKGDNYDTKRVTTTTEKGDNYDKIQSRARSEPNREPEGEPQAPPPVKIPRVANNTLNGRAAIDFGRGLPQPRKEKYAVDVLANDREKLGLSAREFSELTNTVLDGMNTRQIAGLDNDFGYRELSDAQQCALTLASIGHNTPMAINALFAGFPSEDWRGKKGEKPSYRTLVDFAKNSTSRITAPQTTVLVVERIGGEEW